MKNYLKILFLYFIMSSTASADPKELIQLQLKTGTVIIELYPNKAPNHVKRIKELANEGFYDGLTFHRVIDGFMVQTGDPKGDGTGGSEKPNLDAEFNDTKHTKGVVSMARSSMPNSANSQFFIMLAYSPHLDGQYSAFGKVKEGMEFVDQIQRGDGPNGKVSNPDKIIKMRSITSSK
jgi:peptidylprolyl isomerase